MEMVSKIRKRLSIRDSFIGQSRIMHNQMILQNSKGFNWLVRAPGIGVITLMNGPFRRAMNIIS